MAEPQLERFLNRLADSRFADSWNHYDDLVTDIFTYLDRARAQAVTMAIKARDEKSRKIIISNVARLYPLSAFLLEAILKDARQADEIFAHSFETCSSVLNELTSCLAKIEKNSNSWTTVAFQKLQSDIAKLEGRLENLSAPVGKYAELLKKKQELEEKLAADDQAVQEEELRRQTDMLDNELREREGRIQTLKENLAKKERDKKSYDRNIADLVAQLEDLESFATEEQKRAWELLLKDFPNDAHEGK